MLVRGCSSLDKEDDDLASNQKEAIRRDSSCLLLLSVLQCLPAGTWHMNSLPGDLLVSIEPMA